MLLTKKISIKTERWEINPHRWELKNKMLCSNLLLEVTITVAFSSGRRWLNVVKSDEVSFLLATHFIVTLILFVDYSSTTCVVPLLSQEKANRFDAFNSCLLL